MTIGLTQLVVRQRGTPLEGALRGWADPQNDDPKSGVYPLAFDLVDSGKYGAFDFPFASPVHLSAFAHELNVYDSDEDFRASTDGLHMAPEAFIPSGLFKPGSGSSDSPESTAIIVGHVLETDLLKNPLTEYEYRWMRIRTYGGEVDVVSEPKIISKTVVLGGVASGQFWLCGQVLNPKLKEQNKPLTKVKRLFWH